jgi:hypothetical protein
MKTNKFFGLAAIVCGFALSFTSCSKEDNPIGDISDIIPETEEYLISFEKQSLNADGYWCGDESGTPFENWGATGYSCFYTESDTKFTANYTPEWATWTGFAISNRTATTFNSATMTPDQFNCIAGGAHGGDNFCVVYPFGESIDFEVPVTLKGFWYTNNAWTVDAILNGDGMSPGKFEADDWLSCYLTPTPADGSLGGARYEISLAKGSDYVKEWKYCDLSDVAAFKNISSISFGFGGSKANDYGLTTPTYICIDDMVIEK